MKVSNHKNQTVEDDTDSKGRFQISVTDVADHWHVEHDVLLRLAKGFVTSRDGKMLLSNPRKLEVARHIRKFAAKGFVDLNDVSMTYDIKESSIRPLWLAQRTMEQALMWLNFYSDEETECTVATTVDLYERFKAEGSKKIADAIADKKPASWTLQELYGLTGEKAIIILKQLIPNDMEKADECGRWTAGTPLTFVPGEVTYDEMADMLQALVAGRIYFLDRDERAAKALVETLPEDRRTSSLRIISGTLVSEAYLDAWLAESANALFKESKALELKEFLNPLPHHAGEKMRLIIVNKLRSLRCSKFALSAETVSLGLEKYNDFIVLEEFVVPQVWVDRFINYVRTTAKHWGVSMWEAKASKGVRVTRHMSKRLVSHLKSLFAAENIATESLGLVVFHPLKYSVVRSDKEHSVTTRPSQRLIDLLWAQPELGLPELSQSAMKEACEEQDKAALSLFLGYWQPRVTGLVQLAATAINDQQFKFSDKFLSSQESYIRNDLIPRALEKAKAKKMVRSYPIVHAVEKLEAHLATRNMKVWESLHRFHNKLHIHYLKSPALVNAKLVRLKDMLKDLSREKNPSRAFLLAVIIIAATRCEGIFCINAKHAPALLDYVRPNIYDGFFDQLVTIKDRIKAGKTDGTDISDLYELAKDELEHFERADGPMSVELDDAEFLNNVVWMGKREEDRNEEQREDVEDSDSSSSSTSSEGE
ncbi:hypothetical protein EJ06DRAFT_425969 [Trichodelitschia bisporula]|uniref:Uncharacterized protein n=1 Tax=Trichodelitschia bisporula TaxID=703511 RepID=A0A6G1HW79_9PEZI|nr:hypothetical protein EJ06DRAFT_425969 [Trichodelitschia bisporula]